MYKAATYHVEAGLIRYEMGGVTFWLVVENHDGETREKGDIEGRAYAVRP